MVEPIEPSSGARPDVPGIWPPSVPAPRADRSPEALDALEATESPDAVESAPAEQSTPEWWYPRSEYDDDLEYDPTADLANWGPPLPPIPERPSLGSILWPWGMRGLVEKKDYDYRQYPAWEGRPPTEATSSGRGSRGVGERC